MRRIEIKTLKNKIKLNYILIFSSHRAVNTSLLVPHFNQKIHKIKCNKTHHKANFTLGTNAHIFRHQGAILKEFIKHKGSLTFWHRSFTLKF
jgi:hypothetical protein